MFQKKTLITYIDKYYNLTSLHLHLPPSQADPALG
jgi:hypothetical protein